MTTGLAKLPTLQELMDADFMEHGYHGDRAGWLVAYYTYRDAEILNQSNWEVIQKRLAHCRHWAIERFGDQLFGWREYILVEPGSRAAEIGAECLTALQEYPILDERDYGRREYRQWCELHRDHKRYHEHDPECPFCQAAEQRRAS